jgi:hypothetical protein
VPLCVCVCFVLVFCPLCGFRVAVSLIATCVFLASSGVCVRARACLGLYAILVFPRFLCVL